MFTLNVCVDCYVSEHADGYPSGTRFAQACVSCDPCGHPDCNGARVCDCGYAGEGHGFSWSPCEACGSSLGGDRYPLTVIESASVGAGE